MRHLLWIALLLGCEESQDSRDVRMLDRVHRAKEELCACRDRACGDRVYANLAKSYRDLRPSDALEKQVERISREMLDCFERLLPSR
jgi:hypothetical protein